MRKAIGAFRLLAVIAVALAISYGTFEVLSVRRQTGEIAANLGEWAELVEGELSHPAPDPAKLNRLTTDPATGDVAVGLLVLDSSSRPLLSNHPEIFAPGSIPSELPPADGKVERLETDAGDLFILRRRLPQTAVIGESFAVFEEAPAVAFDLDPAAGIQLGAAFAGIAVSLFLLHLMGSLGSAPWRGIPVGASHPPPDRLEMDPAILGLLSREILQLARGLRDARAAASPDQVTEGWEKVNRRTSYLLEIAGDMASLAEMTGYSPPPTEAFPLEELLEDLVADGWGELERRGISVSIPRFHLLAEGDPRAFRRAIWGLIRHRFAPGSDLVIEAGTRRGLAWLTVQPQKRTPGEDKPDLRGRLGLETARVLARACDGEVYLDPKTGAVTMQFSQWRGEDASRSEG